MGFRLALMLLYYNTDYCFCHTAKDIANFSQTLSERLQALSNEWNTTARPFDWSQKSTLKVIAKSRTNETTLG